MNIKKYIKSFLITELSIIIVLSLTTLLYNNSLLSNTIYHIINYILFLLILLINSLILGKKATNKGYLEGIKLGIIIIIFHFILILLLKANLKPKLIFYDLILLITASLGGMIGINKK